MARSLKPYSAGAPHTYAFGKFAALEALTRRPADVTLVLWHGAMPPGELEGLLGAAERASVRAERNDHVVARLRRKANVYCLAVVTKRQERLDPATDHVVLVGPSHPGNLGTAMRSLAAFGYADVALVSPRVDPWGAHVVRASVGLRFALACAEYGSLAAYAAAHPGRTLTLLDPRGEEPLDEVAFGRPHSLLFGPEWQEGGGGTLITDLPPAVAQRLRTVRIPQSGGVESLNLAVAISITAYRARSARY